MGSDRSDAALRDLEAIEAQRAAGELDDETADRLWARYAREALTAEEATAAHEAIAAEEAADVNEGPSSVAPVGDSPGRNRWAGRLGIVVLVAGAVAAATLGLDVGERAAGGFVTGNEATASSGGAATPEQGRDLSEVTNEELEEVVAANPDVVPMRLRLAHRYLDDGELDRAVEHYLQVLEREDDPEAMSHLGWILFTQGRAELAAPLLDESRRLDPQDPEATWFQANLLVYAQDSPAAAVPLLEGLLRRDDLGGTQRADVERTLRDARERIEQTS